MNTIRCKICNRKLNTGKPEAVDCGGDCWECVCDAENIPLKPTDAEREEWSDRTRAYVEALENFKDSIL